MARLPTAADLSGPASLRSGRPIATIDLGGAARGLASLGDSIAGIGAKMTQDQNALDITRAEAYKTEGLLAVQNEFQDDPDYTTFDKRAPARTGEVINKAAGLIRDPKKRELWLAGAQGDAARVNDNIYDQGNGKRKDTELIAFDDALEVNRRLYVDPNTPEDVKTKARSDIEGSISMGLETGFLTPQQAEQRRTDYLENADFSRGKLAVEQDPNIINKPLPASVGGRAEVAMGFFQSKGYTKEQAAGIVGNLIGESNLNPEIRGDGGMSHGIAQWNRERLDNLRRFASSKGKSWQDFGVQLEFIDWELQNVEKSAYANLKNAKTIDEATAAFIGYERPRGWSANNPKAGHNYNGRLKFAGQAAGVEVNPDWYTRLSPEQRAVVDNAAETQRNKMAAETRGMIDVAVTNAPIAIQNTGSYSGTMPTPEEFFLAYGPQDGADRYNKFQAAVETSNQAYSMRTMSADDIRTMVEEATPKSSGDNAALETARYDTLAKAAETTLKAREADPAAYVTQTFPNVAQAWEAAKDAPSYQAAIAASVAAQQQLGIRDIAPLPKTTATTVVGTFKDVNASEGDRINAVASVLMATPDAGQRRAIFDQLVEAGLPDITEGAFEAMARGDDAAARRLMQAAMIDPSKLPGKSPESQDTIDLAIQSQLMDEGQIGDIYYGLSDGTAENFTRAERDSKLISNAVQLRLRNGESLSDAVAAVGKDLYGNVQVVDTSWGVNAQILVPDGVNPRAVADGLAGLMPDVRKAMEENLAMPEGVSAADSSKAVIGAASANYIDNVMANGYFRNSGDGYVFIDPYVGAAIADKDGNPVVFTMEQAVAVQQQGQQARQDAVRNVVPDAGAPEQRGIGMLPPANFQTIPEMQKAQDQNGVQVPLDMGRDINATLAQLDKADPNDPASVSVATRINELSQQVLDKTGKVIKLTDAQKALMEAIFAAQLERNKGVSRTGGGGGGF